MTAKLLQTSQRIRKQTVGYHWWLKVQPVESEWAKKVMTTIRDDCKKSTNSWWLRTRWSRESNFLDSALDQALNKHCHKNRTGFELTFHSLCFDAIRFVATLRCADPQRRVGGVISVPGREGPTASRSPWFGRSGPLLGWNGRKKKCTRERFVALWST